MKKLILIMFLLILPLVSADGPDYGGVKETIYDGTSPEGNEGDNESFDTTNQTEGAIECRTHYDCNKGLHNKCNEDGTEENYFCIFNPYFETPRTSKCEKSIQKSQWCRIKLCKQDDDCYITMAVTPATFEAFESFDCCNNTLDAFPKGTKEYWDRKLFYYFRDYCPKKEVKCEKESIDPSDYIAVCRENICQAIEKPLIEEEIVETNVYNLLDTIVEEGGYIVVLGDNAPASDTLAAIDIVTAIQRYSNGEVILEALMESEVSDGNYILLGHPCDNSLVPLSCEDWPYKEGEALIKVSGDNVVVSGSTPDDTRDAAKIIANYKDYNLLKQHNEILVKDGMLSVVAIETPPREIEEEEIVKLVEEEKVEGEKIGEEGLEEEPGEEETKEEVAEEEEKIIEPEEEKKISFIKRIWNWILDWFRG